jgi:site-specific DNA-methyltransferase (adenine-specific)
MTEGRRDMVAVVGTRIIHGDNVPVLRRLREEGATVHLVYGDPPFCTGKRFFCKDRETGAERLAYDDRWPSREAYLLALRTSFAACRDLLTEDGTMVVHVSSSLAYDVKPVLDSVFGRDCFEGPIVWRYRHWPTKRSRPTFEDVYDVLLRYCRSPAAAPRWTQLYEPLAPSTLVAWGNGRQRAVIEGGRRKRSETTAEESPGAPMGNVWEIPIVAPSGRERTGYPTQKPERLLERVVGALSLPGDAVLDPWCGSGTTVVVARRMGREGIGIDSSDAAVEIAAERCSRIVAT